MNSREILKKYWGFDAFRPMQSEIIDSILQQQDTLALLPTGGGKSICYQVPALMQEGICVVISPLIALMKDQVDQLRKRGIEAVSLVSGMSKREVDITLDNCIFGKIKFLYLSPERLYSDLVQERLRHMQVNLVAIDEAHCISQWGYDFRPAYLSLAKLRAILPKVPFLALTATATAEVVKDIQLQLQFVKENVFRLSFARPNLAYMVLPETDKWGRMLRIIRKTGGAGVVYVKTRRESIEVARALINEGLSADFYHAGLPVQVRHQKQHSWMTNRTAIMVATNAFGMGIDKADVRFVIHLSLPSSLEAYYQEAGRAGRDGKKAFPVLLYAPQDLVLLKERLALSFPSVGFIKELYHHLCNYYQIAYGAGAELNFDFDLVDFAKKYHLDITSCLAALKFLERDGWISLTESVYIPARLKFEVDYTTLYKVQIQYVKFDKLIKAILRTYGGVFDYPIAINEYEFAKAIGLSHEKVVELLKSMQQLQLCTYIPQTDSPQLQFRVARVDYKHLHIDAQFIKERAEILGRQLAGIEAYVSEEGCRSQLILAYFNEAKAEACGVCDYCLIKAHSARKEQRYEAQILAFIRAERELTFTDLLDKFPIPEQGEVGVHIRALLRRELIQLTDQHYFTLI